jgi:molybdopterin/thiamine biosynthesis adenylyltransferase
MRHLWRYEEAFSRHVGLLTAEEQTRLRESRVAIAGMGGVGGVHLVTLGRLGIGRFTIADLDTFETANFNRQFGARCNTIGKPKVEVMAEEIRQINPEVDLRCFEQGVTPETLDDFLDGADLFVDGLDFARIAIRRRVFRRAADIGIYSVTAAPLGFGTAWLNFDPRGMGFDRYFDLQDDQTPLEQVVAFVVGLAPAALHDPYFDWDRVDIARQRGPSAGLACQLCAGVVAAEAVKILLGRGVVQCAPHAFQFDAFRGQLEASSRPEANRHPQQLEKRRQLMERFAAQLAGSPPPRSKV